MVACGVGVVHYRSSIAVVSYHMRVCSLLARSGIVRRFDFWSNLGLLQSGQTIGTISSFEVYPSNMDRLDWASWVVGIPVDVPLRFVQKFKTAGPAAEMIRHMEKTRVVLSDCDAVVRHAVTCGDGAYVGPYSNNLVPTWASQATQGAGISGLAFRTKLEQFAVGQASDLSWECSCEFHILQIIGREVTRDRWKLEWFIVDMAPC